MGCLKILTILVGAISILFGVIFPLAMSHFAGGWVRKYTSENAFFVSDIPDLTNKVAIVTGANTGIGLESAKELARKGATVIVCSRSKAKGEKAVETIKSAIALDNQDPKVIFLQLDLGSLKSVKTFVDEFLNLGLPLHILLNNAGIMKSPGSTFIGTEMFYGYETTADGLEVHIGVNHIGHFYLTSLLLDTLKASAPSRIVSVSSAAEQSSYDAGIRRDLWAQRGEDYEDGRAYGQSKLANILFARELADRVSGSGVTVYSCHPGIIKTELGRYMEEDMKKDASFFASKVNDVVMSLFETALFSTPDGALNQLYLATSPVLPKNGAYYTPIATLDTPIHPQGQNVTLQKLLWYESEQIIAKITNN